jgi:hypothetical protein
MKELVLTAGAGIVLLVIFLTAPAQKQGGERVVRPIPAPSFELTVLVDGRPLPTYCTRGRTYIEAVRGAEYELRLRNSSPNRVAVALFVDGLNTIDARHTSARNASKWLIDPYDTITISGWQMSSERARRFYFTTERDSYGAKLGQTANLGVISAVFFRERQRPIIVEPVPLSREESSRDRAAGQNKAMAQPGRADEDAATGIGRSVGHSVRFVDMDLEPDPVAETTLRYEYSRKYKEDSRLFCPEPR